MFRVVLDAIPAEVHATSFAVVKDAVLESTVVSNVMFAPLTSRQP